MPYKQRVGRWGEEMARTFLVEKGLIPVVANLRTSYGEIDLIMKDGDETVFVEVKTRTNLSFGTPEAGITQKKQVHIKQTAVLLMQEHPDWGDNWRVDVLAILGRPGDPAPEIIWFENAIE